MTEVSNTKIPNGGRDAALPELPAPAGAVSMVEPPFQDERSLATKLFLPKYVLEWPHSHPTKSTSQNGPK